MMNSLHVCLSAPALPTDQHNIGIVCTQITLPQVSHSHCKYLLSCISLTDLPYFCSVLCIIFNNCQLYQGLCAMLRITNQLPIHVGQGQGHWMAKISLFSFCFVIPPSTLTFFALKITSMLANNKWLTFVFCFPHTRVRCGIVRTNQQSNPSSFQKWCSVALFSSYFVSAY